MLRLVTIDLAGADLIAFEAYESKVLPLVQRHGGRVELRVRARDGSREFHLLRFPDDATYQRFRDDPLRTGAQDLWRLSGAAISGIEVEAVGTP